MLEKISTKGFETISEPDAVTLRWLDHIMQVVPDPIVYEIGVGVGATTLPIARRLDNNGQIVLFSREADVAELTADLSGLGYTNVNGQWGSPAKTYSGYHFELARGFAEDKLPKFDPAYIDGGHVFHLNAAATCILKELCKPGGYMVFDDWYWSLANSPTLNPSVRPSTAKDFDQRQIYACHVQLVCKSLLNTDARFEFIELAGSTAVYRRNEK